MADEVENEIDPAPPGQTGRSSVVEFSVWSGDVECSNHSVRTISLEDEAFIQNVIDKEVIDKVYYRG